MKGMEGEREEEKDHRQGRRRQGEDGGTQEMCIPVGNFGVNVHQACAQ